MTSAEHEQNEPIQETEADQAFEQPEETVQEQEEPLSEVEQLRQERDALNDKLLRTAADYQNFIRRSEQNLLRTREQARADLVKSFVTVLDHFDHALSVDPEKTSSADVLNGVQIVRDEFMKTLQAAGVSRIDAQVGEEFDPNRHEAMMHQPVEEMQPNHVAQQLQPGYQLGDRVIRPAKVAVTQ